MHANYITNGATWAKVFVITLTTALMAICTPAMAINTFDPATGLVTIDFISDAFAEYKNSVVEPDEIISYSTDSPTSSVNTIFSDTKTIKTLVKLHSITVDGILFSNVVFTIKKVISSDPEVIPLGDKMLIRGSAYLPHCFNGASPEPCSELIIENAETLRQVCDTFLINWKTKRNSPNLCPIDSSFDWNKNRIVLVYSSLEDYYIESSNMKIECDINFMIYALQYKDHWKLFYELQYPSQFGFGIGFKDWVGNVQAISIPKDGRPITFMKVVPYSFSLRKPLTPAN